MREPRSSPTLDAEATAIEQMLQALEKGLRAFKLYLPNNPIHQRAVANIQSSFEAVWNETDEVLLQVAECDFLWDDEVVWSQPNKSQSIAWVLYRDGIRTVTLSSGVEQREIVDLLNVVQRVGELPEDSGDDLLTLLWEHEFEHISYTHVDVSEGEAEWSPEGAGDGFVSRGGAPASEEEVQRQVADEVAEAQEEQQNEGLPGIVNIDDFDSTLYFLDDSEVEYLKAEIDREYRQDLNANILSMLFDLMELEKSASARAEILETIENFIPHLLGAGDFSAVATVLRELRIVAERAPALLADHRDRMASLPDRLSEPEAVGQLLQSLDEAVVHPGEEELGELFGELRPAALATVLQWLPRLRTQRVRVLLKQAASRLAQQHPKEFAAQFKTRDAALLRELVDVAAELKLPALVPQLTDLLRHDDAEIRRTAVRTLADVGSPSALKVLETAVEDPDRDVRIAAVQLLAERRHKAAFPKIEAAVQGKTLKSADLSEKKVFFEAYGVLGGAAGVAALRAMLQGKGLLRRKADPEVRACAAMALGKIGTPEARAILNAAGGEKDPLVRNAVGQALRETAQA